MVVPQRHRDSSRGERRGAQELPAVQIGPPQGDAFGDRIVVLRGFSTVVGEADRVGGERPPFAAGQRLDEVGGCAVRRSRTSDPVRDRGLVGAEQLAVLRCDAPHRPGQTLVAPPARRDGDTQAFVRFPHAAHAYSR